MTFDEIKEKYPIGKILSINIHTNHKTLPYYSENDLESYKQEYNKVEPLDIPNLCMVYKIVEYRTVVEGWLFDGDEWEVVEDTWDGWRPYSQQELEKFEIEQIKREYQEEHKFEF